MFQKACKKIEQSLYGIMAHSVVSRVGDKSNINFTTGTGFMVDNGYIVTAAHLVHIESNIKGPTQQVFEVINATEIGNQTEKATLIAEDIGRDIALLRIDNPRNEKTVTLEGSRVSRGESCGFLGFPLSGVVFLPDGKRNFGLTERFQSAYISNYNKFPNIRGEMMDFYEIDALMYGGSSGGPGFIANSKVFGMQVASVMQKGKDGQIGERVAISLVIPSRDIIHFIKLNKK